MLGMPIIDSTPNDMARMMRLRMLRDLPFGAREIELERRPDF
jgi:hypothetical protein